MNRTHFVIYLLISILLIGIAHAYGSDIYRLIDPVNGGRYGKSPSVGPPFLKFGSAQQYYYIVDNEYNDYSTAVSNAFTSWNNAGIVQFTSSQSSGLALDVFYSSYGSPGIVNPGLAYTAHNNYILDMDNSYIELNTYHDWGVEQDLEQDEFDVETILVHEIGHSHGLAHPRLVDLNQNGSDPIMAGGDNTYFWNHTARNLRLQDIKGTRFLQLYVPALYPTITSALNAAYSNQTVYISPGAYTGNITMKPGVGVIGTGGAQQPSTARSHLTTHPAPGCPMLRLTIK